MPTIQIRVKDGAAELLDGSHIVCGNSDYTLHINPAEAGWSAPYTATLTVTTTEGDVQTTEATSVADIELPALHDAYIARVQISAGDMSTSTPAVIFCDACATDGGGETATARPDCYNLIMEYIARRRSGQSTADVEAKLAYIGAHLPPAFPGDAYRLAASRPNRVTQLTGTLVVGETVTTLTPDDIIADSVGIAWTAMQSDFLLPGAVPSAELRLTLRTTAAPEDLYGAEIALTYHIQRKDTLWCDIPLGSFTVAEASADTEQGVTVTAYDKMMQLDRIGRSDMGFILRAAYTPQQIIAVIAETAGIPYPDDVSTWPQANREYVISNLDSSVATARDLLSWTVQTVGAVAYMDRFGRLRVRRIAKPTAPVTSYGTTDRRATRISRLQYRLYELDTTWTYHGSNGESAVVRAEKQTLWSSGVTAELPENPLLTTMRGTEGEQWGNAEMVINAILWQLDPITYNPGETVINGDPSIDPLDWISVRDAMLPVTASDWHYRGQHTLTACGADAVAGLARSQAEKATLAERQAAAAGADNILRTGWLMAIQSSGHAAMALHDHAWLGHYTHGELAGKEIT